MRTLIFTSDARRHRFVANTVALKSSEALAVVETAPAVNKKTALSAALKEHFHLREEAERHFFKNHEEFRLPVRAVLKGEINGVSALRAFSDFDPDVVLVFGASIIREPLLSSLPRERTLNLHLGLSPYYRGSGTNFWPFVNKELEYVGATILLLDPGVDTGDIVAHIRPEIRRGDTVHTVGCKVIRDAAKALPTFLRQAASAKRLPAVKQWKEAGAKYYRRADFNEEALKIYQRRLSEGLVEKFLAGPKKKLKLIGEGN